MKYNIEFKYENGSYKLTECKTFPTEVSVNNLVSCLKDWVGEVQQIIIDFVPENEPINLDTDLTEYCENGELSVRAVNGLRQVNVFTFRDLLKIGKLDAIKSRYIGKKTLAEIDALITNCGFHWGQLRTDEE